MANTNGAFGLRPIAKMGQNANSTGASEYRIAASNTNAIYQGSPVIPLAAGVIDIIAAPKRTPNSLLPKSCVPTQICHAIPGGLL